MNQMTKAVTAARGAAHDAAPLSKEQVAHIIAQIEIGLTDQYLRAMWDAIQQRKTALEATDDGLPTQVKVAAAMVKWEVDHGIESEQARVIQATVGAPQPAFIDPPTQAAPIRRKRTPKSSTLGHVSARPVTNTTNLSPVMPLPRSVFAGMDQHLWFMHGGLVYPKADFKGHQVDGLTHSGATIRFEINGVGDKSIKCLIVTEPPKDAVSGKTRLYDKWVANEPVFMPHSLIAPWLVVPTDLTPYV